MNPHSFSYESMGVEWEISIWDSISDQSLNDIQKEVEDLTTQFDLTYSRFIDTSLILRFSKETGEFTVPTDLVRMLRLYKKFNKLTVGKINPLVGRALSQAGYDSSYSLKPEKKIYAVPNFDEAVEILGDQRIRISEPVVIDVGALGKGYFVDILKDFLLQKKLEHFLVNGSGDIAYVNSSNKTISVGLEHPKNEKKVIGRVEMSKGAMCSSGINRRSWGRFNHIFDPDTKSSPNQILATWVLADSAAIADGIATSLFMVSPDIFFTDFDFEYLIINDKMKVKRSRGFKADLF